jgi:protein-tyrosine phosphatase
MFITMEGIENVRDLGGLPRLDGARVKPGVLYRTGKLSQATQGDIKQLEQLGVSAIVDFRDASECERDPDRAVPGAVYHHVPALPDLSALFGPMGAELTPAQAHDHFRQLYRYLATSPEAVDAYARFFEILLASEGKPVLWHCTQGKDRTGVGAMLLLSALGLEEETILQEYMRTNDYMQPQLDAYAASGKTPEQVALLREVFFVFLENAKFYLDCIRVEYGSVALFLELALGVGPRQIETLEGYYLDV